MLNGGNEMKAMLMKEIKMEYKKVTANAGGLFFYYVEGEGDQTLKKTVATFTVYPGWKNVRVELFELLEPEYLDLCKKLAKKWVKENGDVL